MAKVRQEAYLRIMHPRNRHKNRYDMKALIKSAPMLEKFVFMNSYGVESIDFSNPEAVKTLNQSLLKTYYGINFWDIPDEFLCPPIPGRADYIHTVSDLFKKNKGLHVLDIGTGANCIYPLLGVKEYAWNFTGTDTNKKALKNAQLIIDKNKLDSKIILRHQKDKTKIFRHVVKEKEIYDLSICNPPFHESAAEAERGSSRKWKNLGKSELGKTLNFGGQSNELWYPGGEKAFIQKMIVESAEFSKQITYFTTLVSKEKNLVSLLKVIDKVKATAQVLEMEQGNKKSRVLCWTFN